MKLQTWIKHFGLLLWVACSAMPAAAQQFKYNAALPRVDSNRFYNIMLQPNLTAKCQPALADIRLIDERDVAVPYLHGNALPVKNQSSYTELPKVITGAYTDSLPSYIAHNKAGLSIDRLWLKLRNTAVNRTLNVLGSDDLQHWFAIKEDIVLKQTIASSNSTFEELLTFPASNYKYFKIQINNRNSVPLHILQAGVYTNLKVNTTYIEVPVDAIASETRADTSMVTINFKAHYRVDKLLLKFSGSKFYKRRVHIYQITGKKTEWLKDEVLSSANNGELYVTAKANKLRLVIINQDNPPLILKSIQANQLKQTLVAYLEKQHQYHLQFGNQQALAPEYDLQSFADSIETQLPEITHHAVTPLHITTNKTKPGLLPVWLLWVAGGLALLLLLFLTLKMTKEINRSGQ